MNIVETLTKIGLSRNQSQIYLTLLGLGSATAGEITNKSRINRTNVYDTLERLIEKGIVSYTIQSNKKYFEAKSPEFIISFLDQKENDIKEKKKELKKIIPEINKIKTNKDPQEATIYKGKKGLHSILENIIKEAKEVLVFGAEGNFKEIFDHYFDQWHLKRKKSKIRLKIIYNKKLKRNLPYSEIKINTNIEESLSTTIIYENKIIIIVWGKQPIATLITNREIGKSYKALFNILWKNSKTPKP